MTLFIQRYRVNDLVLDTIKEDGSAGVDNVRGKQGIHTKEDSVPYYRIDAEIQHQRTPQEEAEGSDGEKHAQHEDIA